MNSIYARLCFFVVYFVFCSVNLYSNFSIQIFDQNKNPLSNVNVYLKLSKVGIVSDSTGLIAFPDFFFNNKKDSIIFSSIGYEAKIFQVNNFINNFNNYRIIVLESKAINIKEINVVGTKSYKRPKDFGYFHAKPSNFYLTSTPGKNICVKIDNPKKFVGLVRTVNIDIDKINQKRIKTQLRIWFYKKDGDDFVVYDVFKGNEVIVSDYDNGRIKVNVSKFNIPFDSDGLYVGVEVLYPSNIVFNMNDELDVTFKTTTIDKVQNTWIYNQNKWIQLNAVFNEKDLSKIPKSFIGVINKSNIKVGITVK